MSGLVDPSDLKKLIEHTQAAAIDANRLHTRAMMLGYNVGYNVAFTARAMMPDQQTQTEPSSQDPTTSFRVWRMDRSPEDGETFSTVSDVEHRLTQLESMPRYCLDLAHDPDVESVVGDDDVFRVTVTDASGVRQTFGMRVADIENATQLCIHADSEDRPSVGNWREA